MGLEEGGGEVKTGEWKGLLDCLKGETGCFFLENSYQVDYTPGPSVSRAFRCTHGY